MIIQIYRPPNDGEFPQECRLGDINDALSYEYQPHFCGVGTFTLEIPVTSPFADSLTENTLLYVVTDKVTLVIKNILKDESRIKLTGYDLNCLLYDRLTMPRETGVAGAEGKDVITGSTESCVKHFVEYNMISSPESARNYARLAVTEDLGRGLAADSDLVGMECVENVVRAMCEGAKLGYRIWFDPTIASSTDPLMFFDVAEQTDRSAGQNDRNRVIFSAGMKNISSLKREVGISAEKNALWCETGGIDGFVYRNEAVPVSWNRREEYISLSVTDKYSVDEIKLFADKEFADKFAETDSLEVDAGNPLDYGTVYALGDIVTVWDRERALQLDSVISAAVIKRTAAEHTVKLILGESKPKLLDGYAKKTEILGKNQRDFPAVQQNIAYTKQIDFTADGFDLTFEDISGAEFTNLFVVAEDDEGRITGITNITADKELIVTYDG